MYRIKPYDLSQSFKFIPEKKKYSLLFYGGHSVAFTSKRKALKFVADVSALFVETLAICEMVNNTIHPFCFHIKPKSKATTEMFNVYHSNYEQILKHIRDIKLYQSYDVKLYQVVMRFDWLFELLDNNCKILNKKNYNCVVPYQIVLKKAADKLWSVIKNAESNFDNKRLTLFP